MAEDLRPPQFPKEGIAWHDYDGTISLLKKKARPVLLFVLDTDGTRFPFLREILLAMPRNEMLRKLLDGPCVAMLLKSDAIPGYMQDLGAGSSFHSAILSPVGLTPLATFDHVTGQPQALVQDIANGLEAVSRLFVTNDDSHNAHPSEKTTLEPQAIAELFKIRFNELMAEGDFNATHFAEGLLTAKGLSAGKAEAVVQSAALRVIHNRDNEPGKMPQPEDLQDQESFRKYLHTLITAIVDSIAS